MTTRTLSEKHFEALEIAARAATHGKWEYGFPRRVSDGSEIRELDCTVSVGGVIIASVSHGPIYPEEPRGSAQREANARFISMANPESMLQLLAIIRALVAENERLSALVAEAADYAAKSQNFKLSTRLRAALDASVPQSPAVGDDTKRRSCCGNCGQPMGPLTCCEKEDDQPWVSAEEGDRIRKALATTKEKNNA